MNELIYSGEHIPIEYTFKQIVYYAYKRFGKWVLRKSEINAFVFTNILHYQLDNGWYIWDDNFDKLFKDRQEAIKFCIKQNNKEKVKIYNDK